MIAFSDPWLSKNWQNVFYLHHPHPLLQATCDYAVVLDVILDANRTWKMSSSSIPTERADESLVLSGLFLSC